MIKLFLFEFFVPEREKDVLKKWAVGLRLIYQKSEIL
ncbi:hypothetical protein JOD24_000654 [Kroppenstedtia sanguinis]